jgi:NADPH:quinone reductase-like Zn-dependent oxidoreductase
MTSVPPIAARSPQVGVKEQTMKAITYRRYGSPDVLRIREVPTPDVRPGDVLVRVHAASVNALDWHMVRGKPYVARFEMGLRQPKGSILGVDVAGIVEAVGSEVTELKPGDEVFANKGKACAEYVCGPARLFVPKPANVTMEQAAAVPAAGITALMAIRDHGKVQAGTSVLIHGAGGGVGTFTVQIAKAFGAKVTAVTRTENVDLVRSLGADDVIDYTRDDFTRGGRRWDVIIDNGATRSLMAMRRVLAKDGTIVLVGASKGDVVGPLARGFIGGPLLSAFREQRIITFYASPKRDDLLLLKEMIEAGTITPVVDRVYPLAQTPDAMRYLETMQARGKIVITVAGPPGHR